MYEPDRSTWLPAHLLWRSADRNETKGSANTQPENENISLWPSSCRDPTSQPLPIHASPSSNPFSSARQTLSDFI
ncbi:hypothetical protein L207DRAFT_517043 [Hyaloscypha variabilis F]|uniref:Uncharacterized protein n=1 Tax=Hyaloscypha variabilis (strain UAMH 11265 / GT02V1 / F) TaxID=1149755 RepID=A0A2J6R8R8_HYAVF|nr:hypothetical protein L207DRAFT_517043 [Hyaloscypha variabilis F]